METKDRLIKTDDYHSVSIIIPVYNSVEYLEDCIDSIVNQSLLPQEIIIVDDGSDAESAKYIDAIGDSNALVRVYHIANSGQLGARSYGVKKSNSEWVMFVDSDDILRQDAIESLVKKQKNHSEVDCIIFSYIRFADNCLFTANENVKNEILLKEKSILYQNVLCDDKFHSICRKFARRRLFTSDWSNYQDIRFAEDLIQSIDIYKNARGVLIISDVLYGYRVNLNSTTNSTRKQKYRIDNRPYELVYDQLISADYLNGFNWDTFNQHALHMFEEQIERLLISDSSWQEVCCELHKAETSQYNRSYISKIENKLSGKASLIIELFRRKKYFTLYVIGRVRKFFPTKKRKLI